MSWVLILTPNGMDRHPAVIGGYPTRESADQAGKVALMHLGGDKDALATWEVAARAGTEPSNYSIPWSGYNIIPGAASTPPVTGGAEAADALELLAKRRDGLFDHDRALLREVAAALRAGGG